MAKNAKYRSSYKKQFVEQNVYELALQRIERIYSLFDRIVVNFSGGKDSTAVLNMVTTVARKLNKLPVTVYFFDEEVIPMETERYVRRTAQRDDIDLKWFCVPIKARNACSLEDPLWAPWDPTKRHLWVRDLPPEAITEIPGYDYHKEWYETPDVNAIANNNPAYGRTISLLGIRAQESIMRTRALIRRTYDNYIVNVSTGGSWGQVSIKLVTPQYKGYPVYDWTVEDVWTAPVKYGWDYCEAYDIYEMCGIKPRDQRLAPPFGDQSYRTLYQWKECFPDIWEKMVNRVPGAASAALYAHTTLYALRRRTLPAGMTWEDYVLYLINRHNDKERPAVAQRIKREIHRHFNVTADPIAPYIPHPETGLSWSYLCKIAQTGDSKHRDDPRMYAHFGPDKEKLARHYARYWAEIQQVQQGKEVEPPSEEDQKEFHAQDFEPDERDPNL